MSPFVVVIPARMASNRLPGKPMVDLDGSGRPMIAWVYAQASQSAADAVIVATPDEAIADACRSFGASVEMTAGHHRSGTDRVAEVATRLGWQDDLIVVNVQGDEPLLPPELIDQTVQLLDDNPDAGIATLMTPFVDEREFESPDTAKVVLDRDGYALYFSRLPIPARSGEAVPGQARRHIGLYAYRVSSLKILTDLGPCELEQAERLEQLRALWLGIRIVVTDAVALPPRAVDTAEDLDAIRNLISARDGQPGATA